MPRKRISIKPGRKLELDLTPVERRAVLKDMIALPSDYRDMVANLHPEQPLLLTLDELDDFSGYVAAEANHAKSKKVRTILDTLFEKMTTLLDRFTDGEPPTSKTTRKAVAAERDEAERQQAMSDQAAFLATWAAGVLRAAEHTSAKDRVLKTFIPGDLERVVLTTIDDVSPAVRRRLAAGEDRFTLAEVSGMLIAVAGELCVAVPQQQVGMLMVARSLMTAMQGWMEELKPDGKSRGPGADTAAPQKASNARPKRGPRK